jgi:hypothetical protein
MEDSILRMVARLVDETSAPLKTMERAFSDFKKTADTEGTTARFKGMSESIKGVGEGIKQVAEPALSSFGIKASLTAAGVGASFVGLTKAVTDYARGVVDMKDSAGILNMSTSAVMNWDRSMRAVGIEGGLKSMENFSVEMLKIKQNVAGTEESWRKAGLGNLYNQILPHAQRGEFDKAWDAMYAHLDKLQKYDPALAAVFLHEKMGIAGTVTQALEARRLQQSMPLTPDDTAKAERLNASMQQFWVTWSRFYTSTMDKLIPGVDQMVKGMTAGFEKLPEYGERFLNSPLGQLLQKMLERPPETPAGQGPSEIDPKTGLDKLGRDQAARDAAGGWIPQAVRKVQEAVDVVTTGQVKPRTATHEIYVPIEKAWQGETNKEERDRLLAQGADLTMPGYPVAPAPLPDWYDQLEPNKAPPKLSPYYGPAEDTAIPNIENLLKPQARTGAPPIVVPPTPTIAPAIAQSAITRAPPVAAPTQPPASGADVKEGAKQGIIEGLIEWMTRSPKTDEAAKRLKLSEPTADVNRSTANMQDLAASLAQPGDEKKPVAQVVDKLDKPGLQQETKAAELARRAQDSASELQTNVQPEPNESMRRLKDFPDERQRQQQDDLLKQRLLQAPQLMPDISQLTDALSGANKVEGSAMLKVDIAAPPGTRTSINADGLFKQTEVKRRRAFQMEKTAFNDGFDY